MPLNGAAEMINDGVDGDFIGRFMQGFKHKYDDEQQVHQKQTRRYIHTLPSISSNSTVSAQNTPSNHNLYHTPITYLIRLSYKPELIMFAVNTR